MLFRITSKPIHEDNPELETIPSLFALKDRELRYIFLVYDYKTPFRELPIEKRKRVVAKEVGYKMEKDGKRFDRNAREVINGTNREVANGVNKFKQIIFDEDRETLQSVKDLISNIRDFIKTPAEKGIEMTKRVDLATKLPDLEATKKKLAQILEIREESVEDTDTEIEEKASTLELINEKRI